MNERIRRSLEGVLGLGVVAASVIWLSGGCEERVAPGVVDVERPTIDRGETARVVARVDDVVEWASGEVASARHTTVASRVLARIDEVLVRAGSTVETGEVIVRLDARDLAARKAEAREAVRAAEARLELGRREFERTQELFERGVAPQQRLDAAASELRAAEAGLAGRQSALEEAQTAASFAEIRSPVHGRVIDRLAEPGDTAVPGRSLLRIYDPALLRVEAPVRESLAASLEVGDTLTVDVAALAGTVDGQIDEIVPFAERGARTLLVKVRLPRTEGRLFAGMYARVAIPAGRRERLLVSARAIEHIGQLSFAWVVPEAGPAERRLVTTGAATDSGDVEVLSGLEAGEVVALLAAAPAVATAPPAKRPAVAAQAIGALKKQLSQALKSAMAEGGPAAAIEVCRTDAPRITAALASEAVDIVDVGRTSHRLRNPNNAPQPWLEPLLATYLEMEPAPESFRTVDLGERGTGYVEPIYLAPLCATCHGESVAPALLSKIREHYPDDQATGFRAGEFRGLFWAVSKERGL